MSVIQSEFGFLGVSISTQASVAGVLVEYKVYVNCLKESRVFQQRVFV